MLKVGIVIYVAAVIFFFLLQIEASNLKRHWALLC